MDSWKEHFILGEPVAKHGPAGDPELIAWQALRQLLRDKIHHAAPNVHTFVLFALQREGRGHLLSEAERRDVEAAAPALHAALAAHPSLHDVVRSIAAEAEAFEESWKSASDGQQRAERPARPAIRPVVRTARSSWVWSAAAVVALVALVALFVTLGGPDATYTTIAADDGQVREVTLDDGTTVRLMAGSRLRFADPGTSERFDRKVLLEGSAYFVVAPDSGRPFQVESGHLRATVPGTRFGIVRRNGSTDVVLASGAVQVASSTAPERAIALEPGMMTSVSEGREPSEPVPVDVVEALDWTGLFVFRGETYSRIAEHLSRHYGVDIRVAPELAEERQTGTFERDVELEVILATIERSWGFRLEGERETGYVFAPIEAF